MAKIFDTSDEFVEMIENKFDEVGLSNYGLNLKVMSVSKAKDVIKVSKASATTEYLSKKNDIVIFTLYEEAFDRLDKETQNLLIDMAMSNVSFDSEKDRLNVDSSPFNQVFSMRRKYGDNNTLNALEVSYAAIEQIQEEEKARKEEEKAAKKS